MCKLKSKLIVILFMYSIATTAIVYQNYIFIANLFKKYRAFEWLCTNKNSEGDFFLCIDQENYVHFLLVTGLIIQFISGFIGGILINILSKKRYISKIAFIFLIIGWMLLSISLSYSKYYMDNYTKLSILSWMGSHTEKAFKRISILFNLAFICFGIGSDNSYLPIIYYINERYPIDDNMIKSKLEASKSKLSALKNILRNKNYILISAMSSLAVLSLFVGNVLIIALNKFDSENNVILIISMYVLICIAPSFFISNLLDYKNNYNQNTNNENTIKNNESNINENEDDVTSIVISNHDDINHNVVISSEALISHNAVITPNTVISPNVITATNIVISTATDVMAANSNSSVLKPDMIGICASRNSKKKGKHHIHNINGSSTIINDNLDASIGGNDFSENMGSESHNSSLSDHYKKKNYTSIFTDSRYESLNSPSDDIENTQVLNVINMNIENYITPINKHLNGVSYGKSLTQKESEKIGENVKNEEKTPKIAIHPSESINKEIKKKNKLKNINFDIFKKQVISSCYIFIVIEFFILTFSNCFFMFSLFDIYENSVFGNTLDIYSYILPSSFIITLIFGIVADIISIHNFISFNLILGIIVFILTLIYYQTTSVIVGYMSLIIYFFHQSFFANHMYMYMSTVFKEDNFPILIGIVNMWASIAFFMSYKSHELIKYSKRKVYGKITVGIIIISYMLIFIFHLLHIKKKTHWNSKEVEYRESQCYC
ncbi:transporter, putative [Plasmodium berghei]|uniref:Major facilitator superfamily-related transporter, putative n=2 Tax=Plasmodium berghei TaxID=5821 RepID=A0A509AFK1_PLABA|nr:apicomplexan amino acid transporter ApiAT10, putative [Plasmodium berghei ANKA]CXI02436.1 transporter, putative [Plasmodium berghei]SCL91960.1 transporter, putative [Plasmodium berghei]SCM15564.1 transporter, putative [Plasmodium berghei]SCM17356.1 transporter, putative [Plasmodium berghei]SCN22592.1 transporter, putative [Plasmodium berghei]|eukprot:XP_034420162.1 apicomplexan amino acid transporter ApiAT10, putative [Plasmodium berghei ANKA]